MAVHISASAIKDYLKCKRMLYYRLNRPEESSPTIEMIIGTAVHKGMELVKKLSINDIIIKVQYYIMSHGFDPFNSDVNDFIISCFHNYEARYANLIGDGDIVEKTFKIPLYDDVFIVGKMDRISKGVVFDWKTERRPPKKIDTEPQFIIYNWAYNKLYNEPPKSVVYASLVDSGTMVVFNRNKDVEMELINRVVPSMVDDIQHNRFPADGYFTKKCYRCQYKNACLRKYMNVLGSENTT